MTCLPGKDAAPGSLHILYRNAVGSHTFEWTGDAWIFLSIGYAASTSQLADLGWRYVGQKQTTEGGEAS